MNAVASDRGSRQVTLVSVIVASLGLLTATVLGGEPMLGVAVVVLATTVVLLSKAIVGWPRILSALILIILFIPIRRYSLPGNLPFELEPYRVFVGVLFLGWLGSLLVDNRTRLRRTGFEGPLLLIVAAALISIAANADRVAEFSSVVDKKVTFFFSFILVLYLTAGVVRRLDNIEFLTKTLVAGGAVVGLFAMIESRTGVNVFNHLERVIPVLQPEGAVDPGGFQKFGAAKLRVFASAQHPIALSAALVMLTPLALYLARRYRQRRWWLAATVMLAGCAATVSRTGIVMFVVVGLVFLWLRPRETRRLWPAIIPVLIVIKLVLPGTLGALKQSFLPTGGLIAEQSSLPGDSGSGRLADVGPALREWRSQPLSGVGFGTRVADADIPGPKANILDNQWLSSLVETGAIGAFAWLWFFVRVVRRFGAEAKKDDSERGWLLVSIVAGVAAFAVGMLTFDAFYFIQVTFLLFIFVGLGSALLAERPTPLAVRAARHESESDPLRSMKARPA